jgi:HEAT repeat protein
LGARAKGEILALVKALAEALQDEAWQVRQTAANSLGKLGAKAKGAVPALVKRVADDRYAWDYSPGPLHWNKPPDIQGVDKDAALAALKALAPEKVEQALLDASKSKDPKIRRWALDRLNELDEGQP